MPWPGRPSRQGLLLSKARISSSVYIVGNSIVKHVNRYDILRKAENSKAFVHPSHGVTVRCMTNHVKSVLRDNLDHIGNYRKTPKTIEKLILDLAISSKLTACDVSISNILIRKDKHQQKAQKLTSYLKEVCKEINIHYIDHKKSIKPQHLNKWRLHLNKRGTSILCSNFIREISNVSQ